jgi:hypothetical protein
MAEIVRKIGRVTKYETKRYGGKTDMIDLNRAIEDQAVMVDGTGIPSVSTPSSFVGTGRPPTPPATSLPPSFADDDFTDPRRQRITTPPGASSPQRSVGVMAALMSRGEPSSSLASSADPRSAVIRMDTIDEEPPGYARRLKTPPGGLPRAEDHPVQTGSFRAPLWSVQVENVPVGEDDEEHTNPGVRMSDLRRRTTPSDT